MITFRSDFHRLTFCLPTEHEATKPYRNSVATTKSGGRKRKTPTPEIQASLYSETLSGHCLITVNLDALRGLAFDVARSNTKRLSIGPYLSIEFVGKRKLTPVQEVTTHA